MWGTARWRVGVSALAWLTVTVAVFGSDVPPASPGVGRVLQADVLGGYPSTRVVVKFRPAVFQRDPSLGLHTRGSGRALGEPVLSQEFRASCARWGVTRVRPFYPYDFGDPELAAKLGLDRTYILEVPTGTNVPAAAAALRGFDAEVQTASHDGIGGVALFPNDPDFYRQWNMHNVGGGGATEDADIDAPEAWDMHTGGLGTVTLAIIDSGVGSSVIHPHVEFSGRMVPGINLADLENPNDNTIDECQVGTIHGHGTHVTGIAAAKGNNGVGVAGVSWGVSIMPVRVLNGCSGYEAECAAGIIWATDHGAEICNLSVQYYEGGSTLEDAVEYAYAQGVLLIAAAGNYKDDIVAYPGRFEHCMAVSATTNRDILASFSNYGDELDVCAPGDGIWSTIWDDGYGSGRGTSMAAPHVSGLAALLKSYVPGLTHDEIRGILTSTADDLGAEGWDSYYGHGRINAYAALTAADALTVRITSSDPPDAAVDARQPSAPNGDDPIGWDAIELTFSGDVSGLGADDFSVETVGSGVPPQILDVLPASPDEVSVTLDAFIPIGAWTTVRHDFSGTSARIGYLPADVNGDGTSRADDVSALIDALDGMTELDIWQTDVDRDGEAGPADILRVVDLLNGAGVYEPYLDATLP